MLEQVAEDRVQALGEHRAAALDADDREVLRALVLLDDLVCDPHQGAPHVVAVEDDLAPSSFTSCPSFLASRDRVKGALRPVTGRLPGI